MHAEPVIVHCPTSEVRFVKLGDGRLHYLKGTTMPHDRQVIFVNVDEPTDVEDLPVSPLWWERLRSTFA